MIWRFAGGAGAGTFPRPPNWPSGGDAQFHLNCNLISGDDTPLVLSFVVLDPLRPLSNSFGCQEALATLLSAVKPQRIDSLPDRINWWHEGRCKMRSKLARIGQDPSGKLPMVFSIHSHRSAISGEAALRGVYLFPVQGPADCPFTDTKPDCKSKRVGLGLLQAYRDVISLPRVLSLDS